MLVSFNALYLIAKGNYSEERDDTRSTCTWLFDTKLFTWIQPCPRIKTDIEIAIQSINRHAFAQGWAIIQYIAYIAIIVSHDFGLPMLSQWQAIYCYSAIMFNICS